MLRRLEILLVQVNNVAVGLIFFSMFVLVFTNVITRYFFGFSLNWAEELSRYLMIWMAWLGAGLAMRGGQHVAIEFLQDRLPRTARRFTRAFVSTVILAFLGFVAVLGYQYAAFAMDQKSVALQWPVGAIYIAVPLGALMFMLHLVGIFREFMDKAPGVSDELADAPERSGGLGA